jgi:hypothetical protein
MRWVSLYAMLPLVLGGQDKEKTLLKKLLVCFAALVSVFGLSACVPIEQTQDEDEPEQSTVEETTVVEDQQEDQPQQQQQQPLPEEEEPQKPQEQQQKEEKQDKK